MTKRKWKKFLCGQMTFSNCILSLSAVTVSLGIVMFLGATQGSVHGLHSVESLISSTERIADAFDYYNQKRFVR